MEKSFFIKRCYVLDKATFISWGDLFEFTPTTYLKMDSQKQALDESFTLFGQRPRRGRCPMILISVYRLIRPSFRPSPLILLYPQESRRASEAPRQSLKCLSEPQGAFKGLHAEAKWFFSLNVTFSDDHRTYLVIVGHVL